MPEITVCQFCVFFRRLDLMDPRVGECRRHAPRPRSEYDHALAMPGEVRGQWPAVLMSDYCGEGFMKKREKRDE